MHTCAQKNQKIQKKMKLLSEGEDQKGDLKVIEENLKRRNKIFIM